MLEWQQTKYISYCMENYYCIIIFHFLYIIIIYSKKSAKIWVAEKLFWKCIRFTGLMKRFHSSIFSSYGISRPVFAVFGVLLRLLSVLLFFLLLLLVPFLVFVISTISPCLDALLLWVAVGSCTLSTFWYRLINSFVATANISNPSITMAIIKIGK